MATTTAVVFARGALTTTLTATQYTVAAATTAIVTNIVLSNTSASVASAATVYLDGVIMLPAVSVPANSVITFDLRQVLGTGKILAAGANPATVNIHASGVTIA